MNGNMNSGEVNYTMGQKREVASVERTGLRNVTNLILLGVLLAAGIVLKTINPISVPGMKPNFVIAMYCLAILLIKPTILEGFIIGILAGIICQFFPGTPYVNLISESIGAIVMTLLIRIPIKIKMFNPNAIIAPFISTLFSGFSFVGAVYLALYAGLDAKPVALGAFMAIIFGTAAMNSIIVQVLSVPLSFALNKGQSDDKR